MPLRGWSSGVGLCWADVVTFSPDPSLAGFHADELARRERRGELVRLRRGAYLRPVDLGHEPVDRHRQLIEATLPLLNDDSVVSHLSAAVLHGLPVWNERLGRVQVTRVGGRGKCRGHVHVHVAPLTKDEVVLLNGLPVTSLGRTVVDLGRTLPMAQAVAAGDAALRGGLLVDDLGSALRLAQGRPGVSSARRAAAMLDPRSESAGESSSRVVLNHLGLPPSDLQYEVYDESGRLVGRSNFVWKEQRTLGEFDGRVKYGQLLRPGQTAGQAVFAEKLREDAMRDLGWQVARWGWVDLEHERELAERLLRAFRRGTR